MLVKFDSVNVLDMVKIRIRIDNRDKEKAINVVKALGDFKEFEYSSKWELGGYTNHWRKGTMRISKHQKNYLYMIEFNPNKMDKELKDILQLLLDMVRINITGGKDIAFKRIDIKQDHCKNLGAYTWYSNSKKKVLFIKNDIKETIYLGSRESSSMYRIYDKVAEMKIKAPLPIWRIEQEIKGEELIEDWLKNINDFRPFEDLKYITSYNVSYDDIESLEGTNDNKAVLFVHLTSNKSLESLGVTKNRRPKINKMKKEFLKLYDVKESCINKDTEELKRNLQEFIYTANVDYIITLD